MSDGVSDEPDPPANPPHRWASLVEEIRLDHVHGASWLARRATDILAQCAGEARVPPGAEQTSELAALAWALAWARPSMAAIGVTVASAWFDATSEWVATGHRASLSELVRVGATRQSAEWSRVSRELSQRIQPHLRNPIFTLSRSGSVERALLDAAAAGTLGEAPRVYIAESRPGSEGVALAGALASAGCHATVAPDSAIGALMGSMGSVLLGADSVRSDGAVVNKAGTYLAALAARDHGVPVYVLCERLKITPPSYPLRLEQASDGFLTPLELAPARRDAPLFDVTPARLISAHVTERGAITLAGIAGEARRAETALESLRSWVTQAFESHMPDDSHA